MRSRIMRNSGVVLGTAAFGLLVSAGPAMAEAATAYSRAELVSVNVGPLKVNPIRVEAPPNTAIDQPSFNLADIVKLDLIGLGLAANANPPAGTSDASVNAADVALSVGVPGVAGFEINENAIDVSCKAIGDNLSGTTTAASVSAKVTGPLGTPVLDVKIPVNPPPNFGVDLPGIGSLIVNKQVKKDGVITVTGLELSLLPAIGGGGTVELAKTVCGPNTPGGEVPLGTAAGLAAGVLAAGTGAAIVVFRRRRSTVGEQVATTDY
ncbi:choice-of-anchor P family protein [Lentzea atacamensis]|nr:choice-of-anchor P family protein [Lentzea atacamensis]